MSIWPTSCMCYQLCYPGIALVLYYEVFWFSFVPLCNSRLLVYCYNVPGLLILLAFMLLWHLHFYFHHSPIAFYTSLLQASLNYIWTCSKENEYSCNSQCRVFTLGTQNQRKNGLNKTNQQHKTFKYLLQRLYYIFFFKTTSTLICKQVSTRVHNITKWLLWIIKSMAN